MSGVAFDRLGDSIFDSLQPQLRFQSGMYLSFLAHLPSGSVAIDNYRSGVAESIRLSGTSLSHRNRGKRERIAQHTVDQRMHSTVSGECDSVRNRKIRGVAQVFSIFRTLLFLSSIEINYRHFVPCIIFSIRSLSIHFSSFSEASHQAFPVLSTRCPEGIARVATLSDEGCHENRGD